MFLTPDPDPQTPLNPDRIRTQNRALSLFKPMKATKYYRYYNGRYRTNTEGSNTYGCVFELISEYLERMLE
jgi:hypothetical protein